MAKIIARRDLKTRYAYISSADDYPLPVDARDLLKRNAGEYSGLTKEWRVHIDRGAAVIAALRVSGHEVVPIETDDPAVPKRRTLGPPECQSCGHPYRANIDPEPWMRRRRCVECGSDLVLVAPPGGDA